MNQLHSLLKRQLQRQFGREVQMSGFPSQWQSLIRDIDRAYREFDTDREMVERSLDLSSNELLAANAQMRAVFQALPDVMLRLDRSGTVLEAKVGAGAGSLMALDGWAGRRLMDTPLAIAAREFSSAIDEVGRTARPFQFEYRAQADGEARDHEVRVVMLPGDQVLAMIRDISERKRAERDNLALMDALHSLNVELQQDVVERTQALRRQEALFHAAADQAPQVMWIINSKGAVTYLNHFWYELVGGAPPKWHGHEWMETVLPEDVAEMRRKWLEARETGAVFAGTRRVRCADGAVHTLSYRASPVHDVDGKISCWIGMDADITELTAIERALRLSNQELEAFAHSVSHDLRAPLATIDGFCKVLEERLGQQDDMKQLHYLSRIRGAVRRMADLIDSLLSLAQVSRGKLDFKVVDLSQMAEGIVADLRSGNPQRNVDVVIEPGLVVHGDPGWLSAAVGNLISNAWKFTSRRSDAVIRMGRCEADDGATAFYVSDNGAGFDAQYKDKLFGTFQRLHSQGEFPGTGVGLATVKRIVSRHGGRVWADSKPGQGAIFFVSLPKSLPPQGWAPAARLSNSRFGALID